MGFGCIVGFCVGVAGSTVGDVGVCVGVGDVGVCVGVGVAWS